MKSSQHFLLSSLFVSILLGCSSPPPVTEAENELEITDLISSDQVEIITDLAKKFPNGVQFSVAIVQDSIAGYYGVERVSDTLTTIENQSAAFEIGSISKVFTASLLANAVVEGSVELTDLANEAFPFEFKDGIELPFVRLSNHTSGLPRVPPGMLLNTLLNRDNPYKKFTGEKLEAYLKEDLKAKTDTPSYAYSNLGAGLLGYALSKRENMSYGELLQRKILRPLGMKHSSVNRTDLGGLLVKGRNQHGEVVPNWDLGALEGAGAIISTSSDLAKFAQAQFDTEQSAFALTRQKTFTVSESMDMGLGWHILRRDAKTFYTHNGGTGGYKSCMIVDVENKKSVIVLSNLSAGSPVAGNVDKICFSLAKTL